MLGGLNFETEIEFEMPLQWIPIVELFYPDLPQYPIIYVHFISGEQRVYGFPAGVSFDIPPNGKTCTAKFIFLSNTNLDENPEMKNLARVELENRIGTSNKIGIDDILLACNGDSKYEKFFRELWDHISKLYGDFIPFGRFYEEVFSMVRFVSAWAPKTGRQSEMRMLYNFMSNFGENMGLPEKWNHMEFFLLPTYDEIMSNNLGEFPKFKKLLDSMKKIAAIHFTKEIEINGKKFRYMERAWKSKNFRKTTSDLVADGKLETEDKERLDLLVDAFNRHAGRAAFFVWSVININGLNDYRKWSKEDFIKFYTNKKGRGCSEKVVACFLQQAFKNTEVIPIDIWVGSFHEHTLGIKEQEDFFSKFVNMGKLERAIWLSSQANKTNIRKFFYLLWCTRFGTPNNTELRGANPLGCYECKLRNCCVGFSKIEKSLVKAKGLQDIKTEGIYNRKGKLIGIKIADPSLIKELEDEKIEFLVGVDNKDVPKKVFLKDNDKWILIDEFSGYILHTQKSNKVGETVTVDEFIKDLPEMDWA